MQDFFLKKQHVFNYRKIKLIMRNGRLRGTTTGDTSFPLRGIATGVHSAIKFLGDCLVHLSDRCATLPSPGSAVSLDSLGNHFLVASGVGYLLGHVLALLDSTPES